MIMSKKVIRWNYFLTGNLKYSLYFISYIIASFIYTYTVAGILYLCGLKGLDDGELILFFMIVVIFGPPVFGLFFVLKKLHYMKIKEDSTFIKSWSLSTFAKENNALMQIGEFQRFLGKSYHKCIFIKNDGSKIFVKFFPKLGELTADEISKRSENLRIGLTVSNKLYLYNSFEKITSWETIILN